MPPNLVSDGAGDTRERDDVLATIAFGIAPLLMVLAAGWELRLLLLVIWFDTALGGVQALAMIAHAQKRLRGRPPDRIVGGLFFLVHYGGFCAGFFLIAATAYQLLGPTPAIPNADGSYNIDFAAPFAAIASKPILLLPPLAWRYLRYRRFRARDEGANASVNGMMGFAYISSAGFWFIAPGLALNGIAGPGVIYWLVGYRLLLDVLDLWVRVRKPRAAAPAPMRGIVFDVRTAPRKSERLMIGAGFVFMIFGMLAALKEPANPAGPAILAFAIFWTAGVAIAMSTARRRLTRALDDGTARVSEGVVSAYAYDVAPRNPIESFTLNGVHFSYAEGVLDGGFNRTAAKGGPVRDGARLRVHYVELNGKNVIAMLEALG